MAHVLTLYYSLSRQTEQVIQEVSDALRAAGHEVVVEKLEPTPPFPLPTPPDVLNRLLKQALTGNWPVVDLKPLASDTSRAYDLILLGYQPWYLTPSVPIHSFLRGSQASILNGTPVIGLMTCRAMYARATGLFRRWAEARGGRVIEQRVFVDQDHRPTNMLSLGYFLKNGANPSSGPLKWLLKPFGIGEPGIRLARAYGRELAERLHQGALSGEGQVKVLR